MNTKYHIVEDFKGYMNKDDITKLPEGYLVSGSKNVVSTDGRTIASRMGYTIDGAANTVLTPIESSFDWNTNTGVERNLRGYDDELEVRTTATDGTVTWRRVKDSWGDVAFDFATWWDISESQDVLLFVNGDANIYAWSGCVVQIGATTANTITLLDTTSTWAEQRAFVNGGVLTYDKKLTINGTIYTYTGGETTNTLTGVTADPSGEASGSYAIQTVTTFTNKPASSALSFPNDYIETLNNQVYIGSSKSNSVFVSKNTNFTDYSFASPRLPGTGMTLTLDSYCSGFSPEEDVMYISSGKDYWFQTAITLSADILNENLTVKRLKTAPQQGAQTIGKIKNSTVFVSQEPTLDFLGKVENITTTQSEAISDPIKKDFDAYDFTNAHIKYFKNNLYIALPNESTLLIYNVEKGYWEAPWFLPAGRLAIIDGDLYLHSNSVPETYKLFSGYNDNDNAMESKAIFAYQNYGNRTNLKSFTKKYTEGYIEKNTTLTRKDLYDWKGSTSTQTQTITGQDSTTIQIGSESELGQVPLGQNPLGSDTVDTDISKFRVDKITSKIDFYEKQTEFSSNDIDQRWEILAYGEDLTLSSNNNLRIRK